MSTHAALFLLSSLSMASASPLYIIKPHSISRRDLTTGTKAGLGIGIAVAVILLILITTFFIIHFRDRATRNREQDVAAAEKSSKANGSAASSEFGGSEPGPSLSTLPRRQKSVKDRLMGPLYRGSTIDMVPMPQKAQLSEYTDKKRRSALTRLESQDSFLDKPWTKSGNRTPIPSFSSKRATRMMMMM